MPISSLQKLDIIIVNWNAGDQLRECISSMRHAKRDGFNLSSVVIIDNGSKDDSLNGVEQPGLPVKIIRNAENRGFAAACNQGAAAVTGDYLLFLNPDTRLFEGSLSSPVVFMERPENSRVGICGVQLVNESGKECLSYARFPTLGGFLGRALGSDHLFVRDRKDNGKYSAGDSTAREVDQIIGAFFVVRRTFFEQLQGFDERFFVYFEEVDFSLRARRAGWISVCLTDIKCMHVGGGTSRQVKAARLFYSLRSRLLYGFKHFSLLTAITLLVVTLVPEYLGRLFISLVRGAWQDLLHSTRGYMMLLGDMPAILSTAVEMRKQRR